MDNLEGKDGIENRSIASLLFIHSTESWQIQYSFHSFLQLKGSGTVAKPKEQTIVTTVISDEDRKETDLFSHIKVQCHFTWIQIIWGILFNYQLTPDHHLKDTLDFIKFKNKNQ